MQRALALATVTAILAGCGSPVAEDAWTRTAVDSSHPWGGGHVLVGNGTLVLVPAQHGSVRLVDLASGDWRDAGLNASASENHVPRWTGSTVLVARALQEWEWYAVPCPPPSGPACHADGLRQVGRVSIWNATSGGTASYPVDVSSAPLAWLDDSLIVLGGQMPNGTHTARVHAIRMGEAPRLVGWLDSPVGAARAAGHGPIVWALVDDEHVLRFDVASNSTRTFTLAQEIPASAVLAAGSDGLHAFDAVNRSVLRVSHLGAVTVLEDRMPELERVAVAPSEGSFYVVGADERGSTAVWRFQP